MIWPFHMGEYMIFWIVIGVIVVAALFFNYRASVSRDRTIQTLAEKGQPIPPELLSGRRGEWTLRYDGERYRRRNPLRIGVILMCIGVGIFVAMAGPTFWYENGAIHFAAGERYPVAGAVIPFMIGVAFVLIGLFDRRPPPSPPST